MCRRAVSTGVIALFALAPGDFFSLVSMKNVRLSPSDGALFRIEKRKLFPRNDFHRRRFSPRRTDRRRVKWVNVRSV